MRDAEWPCHVSFTGLPSSPGISYNVLLPRLFYVALSAIFSGHPWHSYGWRNTYLVHKGELSGLRLAGAAPVDVYVTGRFVEHFASVNRLGFAILRLSDDASIQHVCEHI